MFEFLLFVSLVSTLHIPEKPSHREIFIPPPLSEGADCEPPKPLCNTSKPFLTGTKHSIGKSLRLGSGILLTYFPLFGVAGKLCDTSVDWLESFTS